MVRVGGPRKDTVDHGRGSRGVGAWGNEDWRASFGPRNTRNSRKGRRAREWSVNGFYMDGQDWGSQAAQWVNERKMNAFHFKNVLFILPIHVRSKATALVLLLPYRTRSRHLTAVIVQPAPSHRPFAVTSPRETS
jgi:hypothetical protein